MNVFNKLFDKVFLITTDLPNERYSYISKHLNDMDLKYDLRVSVNSDMFKDIFWENCYIQSGAQSLSSHYMTLCMESVYKKYETIVIIEDDIKFIDDFQKLFLEFYNELPSDWDIIHLGDYTNDEHITKKQISDNVDQIFKKYTTPLMILKNNNDNFLKYADKIRSSKYPIDYVFCHFYDSHVKCYSPHKSLTEQLSYRDGEKPKKFKSKISR